MRPRTRAAQASPQVQECQARHGAQAVHHGADPGGVQLVPPDAEQSDVRNTGELLRKNVRLPRARNSGCGNEFGDGPRAKDGPEIEGLQLRGVDESFGDGSGAGRLDLAVAGKASG